MTRRTSKYRVTSDVRVTETDLDRDPITPPDGRVIDEEAAEKLGREIADRAAVKRAGRPSLTAPGVHSPHLSARVDPELKKAVDQIAKRDGVRPSEVVRMALTEYVEQHA
jgi:hypothetical protein